MRTALLLVLALASLPWHIAAQQITQEDIWRNGAFRQRGITGIRSMNDGEHYTTHDRDGIHQFAYATGEEISMILTEEEFQGFTGNTDLHIEGYQFSHDERKLLITTDQEAIYRHSTVENYYLVDLDKRSATALYAGNKQRHATFSPTDEHIAFITGNNMMLYTVADGSIAPITTDGEWNKVINGFADWVYEEEFSFDKAFEWAPDGSMIAYYRFDESEVREFNMQTFTALYPEDYRYKYPKAGEANSKVSIHLYSLKDHNSRAIDLGAPEYIPRIKWTQNSSMLAVQVMPRLQNELEILLVETGSLYTKSVYREQTKQYIEINDDLTFYGNNSGFILKSEKDGFFHLYSFDLNGQNERQLTKGNWEVRDFYGYDETSGRLFFSASVNDPMNTEVYSTEMGSTELKLLSPATGVSSARFSSSFRYFICQHSTANEPLTFTLRDADGAVIRALEANAELRAKMAAMSLSTMEFFQFTTSEGVTLNGWMMKPQDMKKKTRYPVLMYVYGGPGSQTVQNSFGGYYWWFQSLCQQGYIVVSVDNRGTGGRGRDFRTQTYGQLGNLESKDQIEAARWLGQQDYVDANRIGIWGWSYGGYMSSLCLFKGSDVFKAAVSVAPVTNWRFYDSIYTERYMGLPQDNASGYDDNSPINHVGSLEGSLLLIHGTGDDNVHYQNSVEMVDALIAANKPFDFAMYPERDHGIYGGNTRLHLFQRITGFLLEEL